MATYVVGDVHGCFQTLKLLVEESIGLSKSDSLYLLGDYIDRGPMSYETVDYLIGLQESGYTVLPLRGNHEQMLLDSLKNLYSYRLWMFNSGEITLRSYAAALGSDFSFPNGIPGAHINFLGSLPYYHIISGYYLLVHGALNYKAPEPLADTEYMLWNRPVPIPDHFMPHRVILYGHTPCALETIQRTIENSCSRLIPLDAGCVYSFKGLGNLVAFELENHKLYWVKRVEEGFKG